MAVSFLRFESFCGHSKVHFQVAAMILFFLWLLLNPWLSEVGISAVFAISLLLQPQVVSKVMLQTDKLVSCCFFEVLQQLCVSAGHEHGV